MPNQKVLVVTDATQSQDEKDIVLGQVVQIVTGTIASLSGTGQIPFDSTPPLIGEGFDLLNVTLTPKSAASKFLFICNLNLDHTNNNRNVTCAVFVDTVLRYLNVINSATAGRPTSIPMHFWIDNTSLTAKALRLKIGADGGGTTYIGDGSNGNTMGGNRDQLYTILEVLNA